MFSQIAFHAVLGLAVGKLGLWSPDQPFDPNNPINPVASVAFRILAAIASGFLTTQFFGQEQQVLAAIGAGAGSIVLTGFAKTLGFLGGKSVKG